MKTIWNKIKTTVKTIWNKIKEEPLLSFLIFLLVLAFGAFVGVLCCECIAMYISKLLGLSFQKNETLKFLGISMGGILIALQALMSYRRAKAMEDAVEKTEQGQRQDRLKNAIKHLGHDKESVRLGGAYELFHLAKESEEMRESVFDILCAHIRRTTGENEYRKTYGSKPSEEVQSLLNLLFIKTPEVFKGLYIDIDLSGTWLNGSNLITARLEGVSLDDAYLRGANLMLAHLQGASLDGAHLQSASFEHAYLQGAFFDGAYLQGTVFNNAYLQGASLIGAHLQEASLIETDLRGVRSHESHHERTQTTMELAEGSDFKQVIMRLSGQESDLSGAIFGGGLSQKDCDSFVKGLSDEIAEELLKNLEPHIGKPESKKLPEDSCAITGSYTKEDAKKWIAEYEKAMSEVPEDDS